MAKDRDLTLRERRELRREAIRRYQERRASGMDHDDAVGEVVDEMKQEHGAFNIAKLIEFLLMILELFKR